MTIPRYIRDAARWIDRNILAPRRQMKIARAFGCDDVLTKYRKAKRQHKPYKHLEPQLKAACHAKMERELAR